MTRRSVGSGRASLSGRCVAIEWRDRAFDTNGVELPNRGVFVATLRWGKVDEFHVYCDTQALAKNLEIVGGQGRTDALAPPIEG